MKLDMYEWTTNAEDDIANNIIVKKILTYT